MDRCHPRPRRQRRSGQMSFVESRDHCRKLENRLQYFNCILNDSLLIENMYKNPIQMKNDQKLGENRRKSSRRTQKSSKKKPFQKFEKTFVECSGFCYPNSPNKEH